MRRVIAVVGSVIFFVIAPCTIAGLVPWTISDWAVLPPFFGAEMTRVVGIVLIVAGVALLVDSFARFAMEGLGTPAPVLPPQILVVSSLYRFVRNPMYVGVVSAILGQALVFGDERLLIYGGAIWLAFHLFVLFYEEPTLRRSFGAQYEAFCRHVPRWLPRLTPWNASASQES